MGAETFVTTRFAFDGITARQAFKDAQEEARHDYGHRGYTGTVAEKHSFIELPLVDGKDILKAHGTTSITIPKFTINGVRQGASKAKIKTVTTFTAFSGGHQHDHRRANQATI